MGAKLLQLCPTLSDPMDYSPPGSSVHGVLQARILKWIVLLQGIFLTQGLNPHLSRLLHWQAGPLPLFQVVRSIYTHICVIYMYICVFLFYKARDNLL